MKKIAILSISMCLINNSTLCMLRTLHTLRPNTQNINRNMCHIKPKENPEDKYEKNARRILCGTNELFFSYAPKNKLPIHNNNVIVALPTNKSISKNDPRISSNASENQQGLDFNQYLVHAIVAKSMHDTWTNNTNADASDNNISNSDNSNDSDI